MGSTVSAGRDNDELVDNLIQAECITSKLVEKVFRSVDRGEYYLPKSRSEAYEDQAWREKNLHLSAPSIYAKVMEALKLEKNLSFLNMGSGTGYLSTMVGLILGSGPNSCNHGVEFHASTIQYAYTKLENFITTSTSFDEYDFCMPEFFHGNCLKIFTQMNYDRIYCGAECPEKELTVIKGLLKINGIAIVPIRHQLLEIIRTGEDDFSLHSFAAVTFAELLPPTPLEEVRLPEIKIAPLKSLCRSAIREHMRTNMRRRLGDLNVRRLPRRDGDTYARYSRRARSFVERYGELAFAAAHQNNLDSDSNSDEEKDDLSEEERLEHVEVDDVPLVDVLETEPMNESRDRRPDSQQINNTSHFGASQQPCLNQKIRGNQNQRHDSSGVVEPMSHLNSSSSQHDASVTTSDNSTQESTVASSEASGPSPTNGTGGSGSTSQSSGRSADSFDSEASTEPENRDGNGEGASSSDESADAEENRQQRRLAAPGQIRASTPYVIPPHTDDDDERALNREKANRYHIAFTQTMRNSVMSLPIPTSLKDYLLYYRNNARVPFHL
ncbi:protein-L-isoaspartate O-methyltransferase domain-containing protein 1-like [Watersipora subatra]|uniref:protein-L-isoaspartate O-methyltransferase domain-containing protein 1-like n=1 Tax=Watersipora subatra TaxID=2589382 RepID=UPI00355B01E9